MNKAKKTAEERKKKKREAEKLRRERLKADPVKYAVHKAKERERQRKRKEDKKSLSINDLTPREQRLRRKEWRERAKVYREEKKKRAILQQRLREDTPPTDDEILRNVDISDVQRRESTSSTSSVLTDDSRQKKTGQKIAKKNRTIKDMIIRKQKKAIEEMKKKLHITRVKLNRLQQNINTTEKVTSKLNARQKILLREHQKRRISVQCFLEKDENSKLCPGKKDTLTRHGKKKQKRYLSDSLENLYKKYNNETKTQMSYTTFTRYRPFWIVPPKVSERDTCLCIFHENFNLVTNKLRQLNIINAKNDAEIMSSVTCSMYSFKCMTRKCKDCIQKVPKIETFEDEKISYKQWLTKREIRNIRGKERNFTHTSKDDVECTKKELIEKFIDMLPKYLMHSYNISHQFKSMTTIKNQLKEGEAVLLADFSENYQCKYGTEAQSAHFGYRPQLSLHTCVLYYRDTVDGPIKVKSFCSLSDCLRHDAAAVFAHLAKSVSQLCKDFNINIKKLHVQSDGPCSQYKNKTNFYLFTQHLVNTLGLSQATWNFSESGHGKGASDGVGGTLKRTADNLVAMGQDIPDLKTFFIKMAVHTRIALYLVTENEIAEADQMVPKNLKPIPETKKVHQITWTRENPRKIYLRELSCTLCPLRAICSHYPIKSGSFEFKNIIGASGARSSNHVEDYCAETPIASTNESDEPIQDKAGIKEGSWIIVRFEGKKTSSHFVGQVLSVEDCNEKGYVVKFLKKKEIRTGLFTWYDPEDISTVNEDDIVRKLPEPTPTRRSELCFDFDFLNLNLLFK